MTTEEINLPTMFIGNEVCVEWRDADGGSLRGTILSYVPGCYIFLESQMGFHLIPWTAINDIYILKRKPKTGAGVG